MTTNVRRIQRYLERKIEEEIKQNRLKTFRNSSQVEPSVSIFVSLNAIFRRWTAFDPVCNLKFGF